jgi:RNA polymerase sigma-70 factor (ECF subfamily)
MTTHGNDDESAFTELLERHRRHVQVHCYRMLGSLDESEDLTQETFLRAWRARKRFEGRSSLRTWLQRIATNACLDALERRPRQVSGTGEVPWLQPFPDELLDEIPAREAEPDDVIVEKETIELAFLVAIQHLPPRQRAVLILRDVLGWPAGETAEALETSVASVNSALQRARTGMREHLPERRLEWAPGSDPSQQERALLERYVEATERYDMAVFVEIMRDDARFSMPPEPGLFVGRDSILQMWHEGGFGTEEFGHVRCVLTRANRQPAVAAYVRKPGDSDYRALALDVLRMEEGAIAEVVTFGPSVFPAFSLPETL